MALKVISILNNCLIVGYSKPQVHRQMLKQGSTLLPSRKVWLACRRTGESSLRSLLLINFEHFGRASWTLALYNHKLANTFKEIHEGSDGNNFWLLPLHMKAGSGQKHLSLEIAGCWMGAFGKLLRIMSVAKSHRVLIKCRDFTKKMYAVW